MIVRRRASEIIRGHLIPKPVGRGLAGLGAVIKYYEMPDAETQAIIAARGDTIEIVPRPTYSKPAAPPPPEPADIYSFQQNPTSQMFWQDSPVSMNPQQFATRETAEQIAQLVGGSVVQTEIAGGSGSPWYDIAVPGTPDLLNAGLVADLINKYGNSPIVWEIINRDLGYYTSAGAVPPGVSANAAPHLRVGQDTQPYVQPPPASENGTAQTPAAQAASQLDHEVWIVAAIAAAALVLMR